jgi:hypothetical protein
LEWRERLSLELCRLVAHSHGAFDNASGNRHGLASRWWLPD